MERWNRSREGQFGLVRNGEVIDETFEDLERIPDGKLDPGFVHRADSVACLDRECRIPSDERPPCPPFTTLDGLEQKPVSRSCQPIKNRDRCLLIPEHLDGHRNNAIARCQVQKVFKRQGNVHRMRLVGSSHLG